ncbi:hypothetical protein [Flavobacterium anhuiense]|uniref:hypothetical protein n=1 Tax=Flavobacterium anhuiense TaxID=459526 RepID=UPI0011826B67|nr:hypothetical protein [Flavobacterium anhuiense]
MFSDSKTTATVVLPREQFDYEINQLAINQKHDVFEDLCRKLAEKLITPNLIPQVGPTGGGDGKTDSETYPVSKFIAERWFVNDNKWDKDENWAFAVSAKKDWKSKVKSDVKKIIGTNRGYTRIYFFSNQKISSRNKKELQDQIKNDSGLELIILDAEWIADKIFSSGLLNDAIDCLNISAVYKEEKVIGSRDAERKLALEEIEKSINCTNRSLEVDSQLIEDSLRSAILSRNLELSKTETIGKFERARNFAKKLGSPLQEIRIVYELAYTYSNWYDDFENFFSEFKSFKILIESELNLDSMQSYMSLINIYKIATTYLKNDGSVLQTFLKEEDEFIAILETHSLRKDKPTTALLSKFYIALIGISRSLSAGKDATRHLTDLKTYFKISRSHTDLPFAELKKIIYIYSEVLADSPEFDDLIDTLAELESERVSELSAGEIYLDRGLTKLKKNLVKESLIYFGKSVRKLAKKETQIQFYYCLIYLGEAYAKLGLFWAANNCLVSAINIYANQWYKTGKIDQKLLDAVIEILENEVILGRLPVLLAWFELFTAISLHFPEEEIHEDGKLPAKNLIDAFLSTRILNLDFQKFDKLAYLPDILEKNQLFLSSSSALFLLGHPDKVDMGLPAKEMSSERISFFFNSLAAQPFKKQIAYETNFLDLAETQLKTKIIGVELFLIFEQDIKLLLLSETILAYLESYLATAFKEVFPISEKLKLHIKYIKLDTPFKIHTEDPENIDILVSPDHTYTSDDFLKLMENLVPYLLSYCYRIKDIEIFVEKLYKQDEVTERLSIVIQHKTYLTNILSSGPKFFLHDWKSDSTQSYKLLRKSPLNLITKEEEKEEKSELKTKKSSYDAITHQNITYNSVIDLHLWDQADWKGFGFYFTEKVPFGIFLAFENEVIGKKIFQKWIDKFSTCDRDNNISLTIIKGIDERNPHWYRILVQKNMKKDFAKGNFLSQAVRMHTMQPKDNNNLKNIINFYGYFNKYLLTPAFIDKNMQLQPFSDLGILKTELKIIDAWEINAESIDSIGIMPSDRPLIPSGVENAPVLEVLKRFEH